MFIHFFIDFEKDDNLIFILSISKINFFHKEIHISFIIIINESSRNNMSIRYNNDGLGWRWYDFSSLLKDSFRTLSRIRKYQFIFNPEDIGKVYYEN